jgi:hypothetical protein
VLTLPQGTASVKNLTVGIPIGSGRVELHGTVFTVTNSVTIGSYGVVSNFVSGASCGMDLGNAATLSVSNSGKIAVVFSGRGTNPGQPYWGLRWAGQHAAALQALRDAGRLTMAGWPGAATSPDIFLSGGYTYVGYPVAGTVFLTR